MNSGNLLNSLLGATSNTVVPNKNTAAKNRVDTSEKFRDALEQARPEVAAPKNRKLDTEPARKAETSRARDHLEPAAAKPKPATRHPDKSPTNKNTAEKVATTKDSDQQPKAVDADKPANESINHEAAEASSTGDSETPLLAADDPSSDVVAEETVSPELINQLLQQAITPVTGAAQEVVATENKISTISEESVTNVTGELLDPLLASTEATIDTTEVSAGDQDGLAANNNLGSALIDAEPDTELSALIPSGATPIATNSTVTTERNLNSAIPTATASQLNETINQVAVDAVATDGTAIADDGNASELDVAENPDFFTLLNAKTGASKLADSPAVTDKLIQVDTTKPALASSPLTEPLTRLTDSQSPAARSFVVQTGVPVTVGQPQWSQAVGEKVLWLAAQNVSAAEIRLDPPDMGQLHVKVSVNQDQASVTFMSPHPIVREALDQQLNRLREMFSEQGLNLVNVDVSDRSAAQQQQDQERNGRSGSSAEVEEEELVPVGVSTITNLRLVDHYA